MEQTTDAGVVRPRVFDVGAAPAVRRAEEAMAQAGDGVRAWLPESWLEPSMLGLQRWQWLAVPVLVALIALLTLWMQRLTSAAVRRLRKDDPVGAAHVVAGISLPLRLFWAALLSRLALPILGLSTVSEGRWETALRIALEVAVFWGAFRAVTTWSEQFPQSLFAQSHPGARALVSLLSAIGRVALVGFAVLTTLAELGYSVTSVLAGLGIGGIALALGAQKTLENVFGAFALAVDQPIREGDLVRIDNQLGTVEMIGLRSTRIRTLERTTVSIPNGKLADMKLETFATRDHIRFATVLKLRYDTTAGQLDEVRAGFRAALQGQPQLVPDSAAARLVNLGDAGQEVEVTASFATADWSEFSVIREQVLLELLRVVERAGTALAFPTQTLQLERPARK